MGFLALSVNGVKFLVIATCIQNNPVDRSH